MPAIVMLSARQRGAKATGGLPHDRDALPYRDVATGVEALYKSIDDKASGRGRRKLKVMKPQAKKEATEVAPVG